MPSIITLVIATSILVLIPGPNVALIVANSLMLLATVYLTVIVIGDALWAVFAASARRLFGRVGHLRNKVTGGFLLGAAAELALSRRTM